MAEVSSKGSYSKLWIQNLNIQARRERWLLTSFPVSGWLSELACLNLTNPIAMVFLLFFFNLILVHLTNTCVYTHVQTHIYICMGYINVSSCLVQQEYLWLPHLPGALAEWVWGSASGTEQWWWWFFCHGNITKVMSAYALCPNCYHEEKKKAGHCCGRLSSEGKRRPDMPTGPTYLGAVQNRARVEGVDGKVPTLVQPSDYLLSIIDFSGRQW